MADTRRNIPYEASLGAHAVDESLRTCCWEEALTLTQRAGCAGRDTHLLCTCLRKPSRDGAVSAAILSALLSTWSE